jgi:glycosyltransferase involved in cell wall biosynthesis
MKQIVYIGNNLKNTNPTTLIKVTSMLIEEKFKVFVYANNKNKFLRLVYMIFGLFKNYKAAYVLIDTYSTLNFYYAFLIAQIARLLKIKYIPILHGGNLPSRINTSPILSNCIFKHSFCNVAPSKFLASEFAKKGYTTVVIPNALTINLYPYKVRNSSPTLLWVRAFQQLYNPSMAIQVLATLKKEFPKAKLCMVGPDKDGSLIEMKALASKYQLTESIEFTGFLSKEKWIEKANDFNYFINTSNFDNMPVSVLEAMALGLPVVSTNVGGISHVIHENITGKLVDENDVLGMVTALKYLILNDEVRKNISTSARKQVELYDETVVKKMWLNLLQ